ncbi:AdoMet-dependent rRNA methyltransferase spb1 [Batrachochytrium dendrobatidis]|nr:AdoMet-dependent rRNA methyltransferase spb1 [Batrachochytrium dendrobatidis]KAK5672195.1 AdoMet-dependent rRNA methyltransferase spb1 [Batrachochytrium dendrobatidis]
MARDKKNAKGRLDKYYHMAKEQGFRARSAFKLIQLNKKYSFLEKAKVVVDLCAAPGGWLQVAQKYMPKPSLIIGLDLAPIKPISGVITHVEDITTSKCRQTIRSELKDWKVDVFLHDGAPNVGISWLQDAFGQSELTLSALKLATEFLMPNGTFVTKVFRSKDYNKLLWVFQQLFRKVEATKPASSRNVSAEIFVVCREYLSPKKIDPRLLDPKWVFKELDETKNVDEDDEKKIKERQGAVFNTLFNPEKRRRFRDGYDDEDYTLHTSNSVSSFIHSLDFLSIMARSHELTFDSKDEVSKSIFDSALTTDGIKEYLKDLKVLGKKEFKYLIKWRESIRTVLGLETRASIRAKKLEDAKEKAEADAAAQKIDDENIKEVLLKENEAQRAKNRRLKKKQRERKAKLLLKLQLGMSTPSDIGLEANSGLSTRPEMDIDEDTTSTSKKSANSSPDSASDFTDDSQGEQDSDIGSALDSDDERSRKVSRLEAQMDALYEEYKAKAIERNPTAKVKKLRESTKTEFEEWYGVEYEKKLESSSVAGVTQESDSEFSSLDSDDSDMDQEADEQPATSEKSSLRKRHSSTRNGDFENDEFNSESEEDSSVPMSKRARVFFDNPIFDMVNDKNDKPKNANAGKKAKSMFKDEMVLSTDEEDNENGESIQQKKANKKKKKQTKDEMLNAFNENESHQETNKDDFAVVPVDKDQDQEDVDDNFILDTAQKYSLAQRMLTKSGKRDLIDNAYNRYSFTDDPGLPLWFTEEEQHHNKPTMPVTKEAVDIIKQRMRALDARPIRKVAEAKFRKQMRTQRRIEKMSKKAEGLNNDEEMPEKSKLEAISKMMSKAKNTKEHTKPKLVVAKGVHRGAQGRPKGVKGRYKMVDGRMKKELNAMKRQKSKGKGRKK